MKVKLIKEEMKDANPVCPEKSAGIAKSLRTIWPSSHHRGVLGPNTTMTT